MIEDLWYKNAVVYCLDVGTYMDSNDDGVGDFEGLMRRLGYLAGIGVSCLWLLPFYPSPRRDDGYDVTDYYGVDPRFGTPGDFVEFTHQARKHGLRVIVDLVVNHTSDQHPWFQAARKDPRSKYRDWYVWSDKRPRDWNKGMVFPGVQKSTWTYDREARAWYFHRFYDFQPDLNTANPAVQEELRRVMGYWLELGVAGFRVDALPFVIGAKGAGVRPHQNWKMLREMREFIQWRCGDAVMLAEANVLPAQDLDYFGEAGDRVPMMFNFEVNQHLFYALASGDARPLAGALEATHKAPDSAQWAHFLRNNDELDLGRLTQKQRQRVFDAMGPEPTMQLYERGIRRRLPPMLDGDRRRLELANSLMFTLPGTPVVRYGDEIGMGDDLAIKERNAIRTPMQWSDEAQGGFSNAPRTTLPVISKGPYRYQKVNVAAQRRDPGSLLNWTERMLRMRKECPEIGSGTWKVLGTREPSVLALRYTWRGCSVVTVHNVGAHPRTATIDLPDVAGQRLVNLLSREHSDGDAHGRHRIELEPYGYRWYRVGGMNSVNARRRE